MKQIYLAIMLFAAVVTANAQCTIDSSNTQFFSPSTDSIPCVERNVAYDQVLQIAVPVSINLQEIFPTLPIPYTLFIDSVVITGITGFPVGITNQLNAVFGTTLYGGGKYCTQLSGTTSDTVGRYELMFQGTITLHGQPQPLVGFDGDTTVDLAVAQESEQSPFKLYVDVINTGDVCRPSTGINDFSSELNAAFFVYPNPNNGAFEVKLNAGRRVNGEINVIDNMGRIVYTQKLDVVGLYQSSINLQHLAAGIYSVQVKTDTGLASKTISIQ